jgi:hypothetical protein
MHADIKPDNILVRVLYLRSPDLMIPSPHRSTSRRHS